MYLAPHFAVIRPAELRRSRANTLWQGCPAGSAVMVIFGGPNGYTSPNWYPGKHGAHRRAPTWNCEVVHAHGTVTVHDDERCVRGIVARLTWRPEAAGPRPWKKADSAPDFIDTMVHNIIGIEVTVTALVGQAKLSQNKASRDRLTAADPLAHQAQAGLAQSMRQA
jgi:transcriptional regulator